MNDPRPRITSARPFESALSVENRWKTRTASSVLSTVTAEPRTIRSGSAGDRGEHDLGRGDREVAAMVLANAEGVDAHLVGEDRFVDDVAQHLRLRSKRAVGDRGDVAEGIQSELEAV